MAQPASQGAQREGLATEHGRSVFQCKRRVSAGQAKITESVGRAAQPLVLGLCAAGCPFLASATAVCVCVAAINKHTPISPHANTQDAARCLPHFSRRHIQDVQPGPLLQARGRECGTSRSEKGDISHRPLLSYATWAAKQRIVAAQGRCSSGGSGLASHGNSGGLGNYTSRCPQLTLHAWSEPALRA